MGPQTLAFAQGISDLSMQSSPDVVAYATEYAHRQIGVAIEEFIAAHGACVVSPLRVSTRPQRDPLTLGTTMEWRQHIMPIAGASDDDWAAMRRRCDLES